MATRPANSRDAPESRSGASTPPDDYAQPRTPHTSTFESPLLPSDPKELSTSRTQRSSSVGTNFVSSPLNPNSIHGARSRPASRGSTYFNRIASEESQALAGPYASLGGQRGSMVLYRLATEDDNNESLAPPKAFSSTNRDSVISSSGDSVFSLSSDSKYPSGVVPGQRGFVPYAYDPEVDKDAPDDDDDFLHTAAYGHNRRSYWSSRGFLNIGVLVILIAALLTLFLCYPLLDYYRNEKRNVAITANVRINSTGQAPILFQMPELIDPDTPDSAKSRTGFDGEQYELVFSDEFNIEGRTFYPGDDPFWEAADLWYGSTADLEWYDPKQVTTKNGALQITMEQVTDTSLNHGLEYVSGMLQSWNKFCFSSGYIEVSMTLPGPDSNTQGYWPGAWTMGNLGRPGYRATTDGTWPYSYDSCDVGTFPNQTYTNGSGPAAALHSDQSRSKYNYELSWLPGQRLSSCTCPGEEHPGPSNNIGRGVPEIDILEAEKNKEEGGVGQVVSQSAQFAPFTHDYLYFNDTDQFTIYDTSLTRPNSYSQQAVSALTTLPDDMFQGSGAKFKTLGFEYWANPKHRDEGFITWQVDGKKTVRMAASSMGPDTGEDGSQVSQRLIPEEPMSIVLNLGISKNWQTISLETMIFPAIMQIDYVRVYQRSGATNIGCDPKDYPTADYINSHTEAYSNANLTYWSQTGPDRAGYPWPKNSALAGGC
ncbi:beta-glucan synthesis-associated [Trametes elegans]|nr:beta-glucan synthesis-associated [Trametes elegans]